MYLVPSLHAHKYNYVEIVTYLCFQALPRLSMLMKSTKVQTLGAKALLHVHAVHVCEALRKRTR